MYNKKSRKVVSLIVSAFLLLSVCNVTCFAAEESVLSFTLNANGTGYVVSSCDTSATGDIVIPEKYNDLPVVEMGMSAFRDCEKITSVVVPDSVTNISYMAFYYCTSLVSVTIGSGVTSVDDYAFYNCTSLEKVVWSAKNVTDFSSYNVFYNAGKSSSGIEFVFTDTVEKIPAYLCYVNKSSCAPNVVSITISDGVTSIGKYAFYNCENISSISIPSSVTNIEYKAFEGCENIASVYIQNISDWLNISFGDETSNPLYYDGSLYLNENLLTDLVIPNSVTNIGKYAFLGCKSVTRLEFEGLPETVGEGAFGGCCNLKTVVFNSTCLKSVGDYLEFYPSYSVSTLSTSYFVETGREYLVSETAYPDFYFTCVVKGDTNGDGVCDVLDCAQMALVVNDLANLSGVYKVAGDSNNDDVIDASDYQQVINKALEG